MFAGDDDDEHDTNSLHSRSSPAHSRRPSAADTTLPRNASIADSIASSRASIISSLSEREINYGWSSGGGALANARRAGTQGPAPSNGARPLQPPHLAPPGHLKHAYRPPFSPKFDLHERDEEDVDVTSTAESIPMPVLRRRATEEPAAGGLAKSRGADLTRGKSLKDKIVGAFKSRSPSAEIDDPMSREGLVRRLSRKATRPKARIAERTYDEDSRNLGHFSSRLAEYDEDAVASLPPEISNIPLYAAPDSAHVPKDAPALSSFAPRAPLRPRSQTVGSEAPKPATTVGQAARAYSIKRAQTMAARTSHDAGSQDVTFKAAGPTSPKYKPEEREMRRAARKPKVVPEGWATAGQLEEKDEETSTDKK